MKQHTRLALLATLIAGPALAQDVTVSSTTIAQTWKQQTPGSSTSTLTPATEYVGLDANRLAGKEALSFHFYGWAMADLADQSRLGGKNNGDFTYGYLQYDFARANAQLKAGRFTVNQGVGNEQVDGVTGRTDLRYGFTASAFAGSPVVYKNDSSQIQSLVSSQRNFIYGARLAWHTAKLGEVGVDFLQDGSNTTQAAVTAPQAAGAVYTRKLVGIDLKLAPCTYLDLSGRTVYDLAPMTTPAPGQNVNRVAEDDYNATVKLNEKLSLGGSFVERNLFAYYAGTTLPTLFNQGEQGMFKATGAKAVWLPLTGLQVTGDVRRTDREIYGTTTRSGGDLRYNLADAHVMAGLGYHRVIAFSVTSLDATVPSYSLSHSEERIWAMAQRGALSASLDVLRFHYWQAGLDPNLNGKSLESAIVGSLGYQAKNGVKVSGDLTFEDTPIFGKQTIALARVEYRFGLAGKGEK